jgi:hypothetical protein
MMDILDGFQKLVSTWRTFSISIGLDCRDPQGYFQVSEFQVLVDPKVVRGGALHFDV